MKRLEIVGRATVKPGRLAECKAQTAQSVARVMADEPGTLRIEAFLSKDETEFVYLDTYADSEALLAHMANVAAALSNPDAPSELTSIELFGNPSPEVRAALEPMGVKIWSYVDGMCR